MISTKVSSPIVRSSMLTTPLVSSSKSGEELASSSTRASCNFSCFSCATAAAALERPVTPPTRAPGPTPAIPPLTAASSRL